MAALIDLTSFIPSHAVRAEKQQQQQLALLVQMYSHLRSIILTTRAARVGKPISRSLSSKADRKSDRVQQTVRGTHDLYGEQLARHKYISHAFRDTAIKYGFQEIATPVLEHADLFKRGLGDTSDVVFKEMYQVSSEHDKDAPMITLRPENTASIVRAVIGHQSDLLTNQLNIAKLYYEGPMFRHERPQHGRLRQFHQVGIEYIGSSDPWSDVESVDLALQFLSRIGMNKTQYRLEINSLGDTESRLAYKEILSTYLAARASDLSPLSQTRLARGSVLRILDSKDVRDQEIVRGAPELIHSLTPQSRARMEDIKQGLTALGHEYSLNTRLVRGLDYYSELCFEVKWQSDSSDLTVLAGGRYDGLAQQLGHTTPLPAVGWAAGIERLALLLSGPLPSPPRSVVLIQVPGADVVHAAQLTAQLRAQGVVVDVVWDWRGDVSKQLRYAVKRGASAAVFVGPDEVARGVVSVKDLTSSQQRDVPVQELVTYLNALETPSESK